MRLRSTLRRRAPRRGPHLPVFELPVETFIRYAYNIMLRREPDAQGRDHFTELLNRGQLDRNGLLDHLRSCEEFRWNVNYADLLVSIHYSRVEFVAIATASAPHSRLGRNPSVGQSGRVVSALHYPYPFDDLTIVDLPPSERDEIYRHSEMPRASLPPRAPFRTAITP